METILHTRRMQTTVFGTLRPRTLYWLWWKCQPAPGILELTTEFSQTITIPQVPTPPSPTPVQQTGQIFYLPHQVLLPPSPKMTAKPKELHIAMPEHYDRSYAKTLPCLTSVLFYIKVNEDIYNTDVKKIAFTHSYIYHQRISPDLGHHL